MTVLSTKETQNRPLQKADQLDTSIHSPVSLEQKLTILVFLAALFVLGALTWILKPPAVLTLENRYSSPLPKLEATWKSILAYPRAFEAYFNDRFALRTKIISVRNLISYNCLHYSGSPDILVGSDGWLEYRADHNLDSYLNRQLFTPEELVRVGSEIENRRAWLAKRGIRFLFVVVPNKSTLCPSMPTYYKRSGGTTRLDQLLAYLASNTTVETLDLRQTLKQAGAKAQGGVPGLYWKTDTHWNDLGAFKACSALSQKLKQWFPRMRAVADVRIEERDYCGDLARIAGLQKWLHEKSPAVVPCGIEPGWTTSAINPPATDIIRDPERCRRVLVTQVADPALPRAVILHDSFMLNMQPLLSYNFQRAVNMWTYEFPTDTIAYEKPDLVICEQAERQLVDNIPKPTAGLTP